MEYISSLEFVRICWLFIGYVGYVGYGRFVLLDSARDKEEEKGQRISEYLLYHDSETR